MLSRRSPGRLLPASGWLVPPKAGVACLLPSASFHTSSFPGFTILSPVSVAAPKAMTKAGVFRHLLSDFWGSEAPTSAVLCHLLSVLWFLTLWGSEVPWLRPLIPLKSLAFPGSCEYHFSVFRCLNLFEIREDERRRPYIENIKSPISQFPGHGALSSLGVTCFTNNRLSLRAPSSTCPPKLERRGMLSVIWWL